ncbi:MAG: HNH endonuclease [Desulfovibrionaceae bacterium]|nr:HNH endonuclease [Desulfovibrionaceae bacterium]
MVKFGRLDTNTTRAAIEKLNTLKRYNCEEVNEALNEVFHNKCYLCENKKIKSRQIDHLNPSKNLKFKWENLFLSCAHCNNIKGKKFPILNCCKENVMS